MPYLELFLLGLFQVKLDGQPLSGIKTDKGRALLAYLAVERNHPHRRQVLAGLLWPDYPERSARENLRHALSNLRQVLDDEQNPDPFILVDGDTLQFNPESDFRLDLVEFESLATSSGNDLESAFALYRGGFLEGFTLKGSPDFDNWTAILRERYQGLASTTLGRLAEGCEQSKQYDKAISYVKQRLELEPWQEDAHRQLMRLMALSNQRPAALAQYEACRRILKDELGVEPSLETIRLYEDIRAGKIAVQKKEEPPKHNLPALLTSFIGREKEIEQVISLLHTHRLVTLTGSGGIGKTRLALQSGMELLKQYPDGVWLVELAPLSDPELVVQTVASAVGMQLSSNPQALSFLQDYLQSKRLLLVLDNCEHLVEVCARLAETLLLACPHLSILATSREILDIQGETPFTVPPLSLPDPQNLPDFETLSQYEAIQLFMVRASTASSSFHANEKDAPAIAQVCQRLDGIPLAIELAAARVTVLSVEEIAFRLKDRFRLLAGGSRTALPRYQTLRASVDWSYELLTPPERNLLQRLSVFAGSWVLEAAEYVGSRDDSESCEVLDLLEGLVNKSLISVESGAGPQTRYRMLETIRQYTHEKLVESGEEEMTRDRHLEYYVGLADRMEGKIRGSEIAEVNKCLEVELDNFRLAFEWCLMPLKTPREKIKRSYLTEKGLRMGAALLWFWYSQQHREEGLQYLNQLLSIQAELSGKPDAPEERLDSNMLMSRANAIRVSGRLKIGIGEHHRALELLEESKNLYCKLGEQGEVGYAITLEHIGALALYRGDYAKDEKYLAESLAIFRKKGEKFWESEILVRFGWNAMYGHAYERARPYLEESLALKREFGDLDGIAWVLNLLGKSISSYCSAPNPRLDEQAHYFLEESREIFRRLNTRSNWQVNMDLGLLYWRQGDFDKAVVCFSGDKYYNGLLAISQGDYQKATELFYQAMELAQKQNQKIAIDQWLICIGALAWATGDIDQSEQAIMHALSIARELGVYDYIADALLVSSRVYLARGDHVTAQACLMEALEKKQKPEDQEFLSFIEGFAIITAESPENVSWAELKRSARLLGATQALHTKWQLTRMPKEHEMREKAIASLKQSIGEEAFTAAFSEGMAMSLEQSIAYAKQEYTA